MDGMSAVMPRLRRSGPFDQTGEGDPMNGGGGGGVMPIDNPIIGDKGPNPALADPSPIPTAPPKPLPDPTPGSSPSPRPPSPTDMSGGLPGVSADDVLLASSTPAQSNATAGTGKVSNGNHPTPSDIDLPNITTMPGYQHMTDLQGQLSDANKPMSTKAKIIRAIMEAAPVAIGGALGGMEGAGGAASGVNSAVELAHNQGEHHKDDLIRQVQQAQGQVTTQYDHNLQARNIAATRDMTAQWHYDNIIAQNGRADNRNDTNLRLHGVNPDGTPIAEGDMTPKELAAVHHQKAQDAYLQAETDYRNAVTQQKLPADIQNAKDRLDVARHQLSLAAQRNALAARGMDLREEGLDYRENGPTAQQKNQIGQADVIQQVGPKLIQQIRNNADLLGPYNGRATNIEEFVGNLPPQAAYLSGLQGSFAALQPQLHGMRGQGAMKNFEARLQAGSFKTNAEAMEAAVQATIDSAATIHNALKRPLNSAAQNRRVNRNNAQNGNTVGPEEHWGRDGNGNPVRLSGGQ